MFCTLVGIYTLFRFLSRFFRLCRCLRRSCFCGRFLFVFFSRCVRIVFFGCLRGGRCFAGLVGFFFGFCGHFVGFIGLFFGFRCLLVGFIRVFFFLCRCLGRILFLFRRLRFRRSAPVLFLCGLRLLRRVRVR